MLIIKPSKAIGRIIKSVKERDDLSINDFLPFFKKNMGFGGFYCQRQ